MVSKLLRLFLKPIFTEFPFFMLLILLFDYWAIYQFLLFPADWLKAGVNLIRSLLVSMMYSYTLAFLVHYGRTKILKFLIYFIGILIPVIDIFHYLVFNKLLMLTSLLLMLETNQNEIVSFFDKFVLSRAGITTIVVALFLILICYLAEKIRDKICRKLDCLSLRKKDCLGCIVLLVLLGGFSSFKCNLELYNSRCLKDTAYWNESYIYDVDRITNLLFCLFDIIALEDALHIAEKNTLRIKCDKEELIWPDDSTVIILVVGESYIKSHCDLYGYSHRTTPLLELENKKGNLFAFNDVVSPNMYTMEALRNVFNTNSVGDNEKWYDYPFFPAIFHYAGYRVLFWDNQDDTPANDPFDFSLSAYLHSPVISELSYDAQHPYVSLYDGELIDNFSKYWSGYHNGTHHLVMFHLQGQHFKVEDRYPQVVDFQKFVADSIKRTETWMTDEKKQEIAYYDNCTLYNDSVIAQIISIFRDESSVLVYLSDHGENVYDIGDCVGRLYDIPFFYEIPFMIWCSDKYKERHGDIVESIENSVDKPLMSDNLCHLLMRLGGVKSVYYHEDRDVLSPHYICPPRIIGGSRDYDLLKQQKKE